MSEGDVWFFARGQEVVGPFSREILRQIHEGGQLPPETLVWREGMDGWKAVRDLPELGIGATAPAAPGRLRPPSMPPPSAKPAPAPPPAAPLPSPAGASPAAPKLKVRARADGPIREGPPPSTALRKSLAPDGESPVVAGRADGEKVPVAGHGPRKPASWAQRAVARVFSSLVMTPLFLMAAAALAMLAGPDFPNVLGLLWIVVAFGIFGAVSLCGVHGFDGTFRWLALAALLPPLAMFWPVLMREVPVDQVTGGQWAFLVLCALYFTTMRIGLRSYLGGVGMVGVATGLFTLGFLLALWKTDLEKGLPGWEPMVKQGSEVRLPGVLARLLNMPQLGTRVGTLRLRLGAEEAEVGIERAALEARSADEWRFILVTLDGQQFSTKWKGEPSSVKDKDLPILVFSAGISSREGLDEMDSLAAQTRVKFKGKAYDLGGGTLRFSGIGAATAQGSLSFGLTGQKDASTLAGEFQTKMVRR